ncbi:MAG: ABC transporter ATP-binding protein [Akkermansiaceae bacterium]
MKELTVRNGDFEVADLSFEIAAGECVALMGPSGCGKTTVVEVICGVRDGQVSGMIVLDGSPVTGLLPGERGIGWVPQDLLLFPAMSVKRHLELGPSARGWGLNQIEERVEELAQALGLENLLKRLPGELSGGEARRVALGRALAARPRLLCLDEALTGLDEKTHCDVLELIKTMIKKEGVAALQVTHSRQEADELADRVVKMIP